MAKLGHTLKANGALLSGVFQAGLDLLLAYGIRINVNQLGAINAFVAALVGTAIHWSAVNETNAGNRNGNSTVGPIIIPSVKEGEHT